MISGNRYNQRKDTCVSLKLMVQSYLYRRKDYTRPVNFVSSNQREGEDEGDSDSDKEVSKMGSIGKIASENFAPQKILVT